MSDGTDKIFVSYRREETSHLAGRLADELADRYGTSRVFMDIDSISPGADFVEAINRAVGNSAVLLVVIGSRWASLVDRSGHRKLDDPDDFVVREVSTALAARVPVVPVLADGAEMPTEHDLPEILRPLSRRNAVRLDAVTFRRDTEWLLDQLAAFVPPPVDTAPPAGGSNRSSTGLPTGPPHRRHLSRRALLGLAGTASVATAAAAAQLRDRPPDSPRARWSRKTGGEVYSSPRLSDGVVYVGSNDHHLYAMTAASGSEVWRYPTGGAVTSSPAIGDGLVYVGSNDQSVHAVEVDTGEARWTFPTEGSVHSSPALAEGLVIVGSRDNHLYALDARDGAVRWAFPGGDWFNSSPIVADGAVFVGCRDHEIYCLDLRTGDKRWSFTTESTVDSSAAVSGGTMWIGSDDGHVYALTTAEGAWIWQTAAGGGVVSRPLVVAGVLYVGSDDGDLHALDAGTGRRRWSFPTGNQIRSSPAAGEGVVYVGGRDRFLYAVDTVVGEERWRFETRGPIDDSSPVVTAEAVIVGSLDGSIYAVVPPNGLV